MDKFNPVDGKGIKNENITRFDYALRIRRYALSEQDAFIETGTANCLFS